jgi:peptide/nickel transport system permease protein
LIRFVARRLSWALFVIWAVATTTFFVNAVLPSDPARLVAGPQARPADVARIRADLGLDRAMHERYAIFMHRLVHLGPSAPAASAADKTHATCGGIGALHFDLGRSYTMRRPVVKVLEERVPRTLQLAAAAIVLQLVIGVGLGALAAARRHTKTDRAAVITSLLGVSAPTFLTGLFLQFVLGHKLRLLPLDGYGKTTSEHVVSVVLPALTLGLFGAASYTRLVRDEMLGFFGQDFIRTARAKGAGGFRVVVVHALRNALVPIVTMLGLDVGTLVGGAVVTETLFRWPGIGAMSVNAMLDRDGPLLLGSVIVTSAAVVVTSFLADVCYAALDPRLRRA